MRTNNNRTIGFPKAKIRSGAQKFACKSGNTSRTEKEIVDVVGIDKSADGFLSREIGQENGRNRCDMVSIEVRRKRFVELEKGAKVFAKVESVAQKRDFVFLGFVRTTGDQD